MDSKVLSSDLINLDLNPGGGNKSTYLKSIINGCNPSHKEKCEPIWVRNQRNDFDSAFINWPNQLLYNAIWPTYDYGCGDINITFDFKMKRMLNWMSKPKTTLGFMYITALPNEISRFLDNVSQVAHDNHLNIILIFFGIKQPLFMAIGPKFKVHSKLHVPITLVDIYPIIENILLLSHEKFHRDGNVTLASLLVNMSAGHPEVNILTLVISKLKHSLLIYPKIT